MMIEQEFDKKRNPYKGTLYYSGNGLEIIKFSLNLIVIAMDMMEDL
jgi:hypothetical protein